MTTFGQTISRLFKPRTKIALHGYDAVAYFTQGKPVKGSKSYTYHWMDKTWYFSTAEHRDLFVQHPERYAPQYGGYCAYAVSQGTTADIDPHQWKIVRSCT